MKIFINNRMNTTIVSMTTPNAVLQQQQQQHLYENTNTNHYPRFAGGSYVIDNDDSSDVSSVTIMSIPYCIRKLITSTATTTTKTSVASASTVVPSEISIIDLSSSSLLSVQTHDPWWVIHRTNAFDEDDEDIVDNDNGTYGCGDDSINQLLIDDHDENDSTDNDDCYNDSLRHERLDIPYRDVRLVYSPLELRTLQDDPNNGGDGTVRQQVVNNNNNLNNSNSNNGAPCRRSLVPWKCSPIQIIKKRKLSFQCSLSSKASF